MLNKIIDLSLRNALLVLAFAVFLTVYGLYALSTLSVDVFPDLNRPVVTIFAEAEGLAQITIIGGERKEYQVLVDPNKLRSYNVSLHEVEEAMKSANTNSTGGFLIKGSEEVLIRNLGMVATLDDLQQAVVRRERER